MWISGINIKQCARLLWFKHLVHNLKPHPLTLSFSILIFITPFQNSSLFPYYLDHLSLITNTATSILTDKTTQATNKLASQPPLLPHSFPPGTPQPSSHYQAAITIITTLYKAGNGRHEGAYAHDFSSVKNPVQGPDEALTLLGPVSREKGHRERAVNNRKASHQIR